MIIGIGIDLTDITEIRRYLADERLGKVYVKHTFTPAEQEAAKEYADQAEYYAARFAAKEAVFKALAHDTREQTFDLRIIETLHTPDGHPYVSVTEPLQRFMEEAGADRIHLSITTENGYAAAFAIAEKLEESPMPY